MSLRPWYPTIILSATTSVSTKRSLLTERLFLWVLLECSLSFWATEDDWTGDVVPTGQGALFLMRSANKETWYWVICVQFLYRGCTCTRPAPLKPNSSSLCFMAQMLWEKAIRWYKLRHASFLAMTDFAVPWRKYLNIHLVLFSNSSHLSTHNIWRSCLNSKISTWHAGSANRTRASTNVRAVHSVLHWSALCGRLFLTGWKVSRPGAAIAHKKPGLVFKNFGPRTKPALPQTCYV